MSFFSKSPFGRLFNKRSINRRRRALRPVESLEGRRMLAVDAGVVLGDANTDGLFNSDDLITVFQAGKFETGEPATFQEGDWDDDGLFTTDDLLAAFQVGHYNQPTPLSAEEATEDGDGDQQPEDQDNEEERERRRHGSHLRKHLQHLRSHIRHHLRHHHDEMRDKAADRLRGVLSRLTNGLENDNLPPYLSADDAQRILDGLKTAIDAGDRDTVESLLGELRQARRAHGVQMRIDRINDAIAEAGDDDTVHGLPKDQVQTSVDTAAALLGDGDVSGAVKELNALRKAAREAQHADRAEMRLQAQIERLQAAVDEAGEDGTVGGLPVSQVQQAIADATAAMTAGDLAGARKILAELHKAQQGAKLVGRIQAAIDAAQQAVNDAAANQQDMIGALTLAEAQEIIDAANEALGENNLRGARAALHRLHQAREHDDNGRKAEQVQRWMERIRRGR